MALIRQPPGPLGLAAMRHLSAYVPGRDLILEAQVNHCLEAKAPVLRLFNIGPEGVAHAAECLKRQQRPHIVALEIAASTDDVAKPIGDRGATFLRAVLRSCPSIQRLDLRGNHLGDGAVRTLVAAIEDCTTLRWLELSGNHFSTDGARHLLLACHSRGGLHLRGVAVPQDVLPLWLAARCPELELSGFGDQDVHWLAERFTAACAKHLQTLKLEGRPDRHLGPAGAAALVGALGACKSLRVLQLSFHGLIADGVKQMVEPLGQFSMLRVLDLSNNSLGTDVEGSASALSLLLSRCVSLETLDLSNNGFESQGFAERLLRQLRAFPPPGQNAPGGVELVRGPKAQEVLMRPELSTSSPQRHLTIHILGAARRPAQVYT
uniref:F-box/LRR-repeat protein 15/At3g58940/PEG3-like LRR domain-containing protein n=1 Tax=Alexandrium monilatum TaxID=311494 RepID=A0A7S4W3W6_9DINO